ncbi:tryptophan synthase subunit alpha [Roseibium sp. Sym1]|uniref:tryptophan synthase subunit alpha n=1 Tax=Roseibium sp. Sym1 TaxID=3016006 RepID=UPI0022B2FC22|nr:tryptophan synthase subunit alpha [Roseibium sp. Sym1]
MTAMAQLLKRPDPETRSLCPLIMAGDPDLQTTRSLLQACVDLRIGMVELCVPFHRAFTDGPTLQRAHARGLAAGTDLEAVLAVIRDFSHNMDIVLLADCSHTLLPNGFAPVCEKAREAGAAAILPHGLPPRLAPEFISAANGMIPVVGTLYVNSADDVCRKVLAHSSAFIYLVSAYGRSGGQAGPDAGLRLRITDLKLRTRLPIALGFGLKTPANVSDAFSMGCDIAIVGSAVSAAVESGIRTGDPVRPARELMEALNAGVPA